MALHFSLEILPAVILIIKLRLHQKLARIEQKSMINYKYSKKKKKQTHDQPTLLLLQLYSKKNKQTSPQ